MNKLKPETEHCVSVKQCQGPFKRNYVRYPRVQLHTPEPTLTEQHHKEACDINNVLKRYRDTGVIEHRNQYEGFYADISGIDFTESQNKIANAQSMFEELPAHMRRFFNDSPAFFLDYVQNPDNKPALYDLGLAIRPEGVQPGAASPETKPTRRVGDSPLPEGGGTQ